MHPHTPHPAPEVRVLLVDDDPYARSGVRQVLENDPRLKVVAEAGDGDEVIEACNRHLPDVVLMDLRMKRMGGIEATAAVCRRANPPRVIALTSFDLDRYVYDALQAGAAGFLLKGAAPDELRRAVHTVMAGDAFLSPRSTRHLIAHFSRSRHDGDLLAALTAREREIALLVHEGLSNPEIAQRLYLSDATVKTHLSRLMAKLDASTRVHVALAVERSTPAQ